MLTDTLRRAGPFTTNGSTTEFAFAFKVFDETYLRVVSTEDGADTDLVLGVGYEVALNADQDNNPGGTITTLDVLDGPAITLYSDQPYDQPAEFTNQGGFYPRALNDALDRQMIATQQLAEEMGRAYVGPADLSLYEGKVLTVSGGALVLADGTPGPAGAAGAGATPTVLFTDFGTTSFGDATVVTSTGYSVLGIGAAWYVADADADAALAAAFPRCCKADADGTYWRLIPGLSVWLNPDMLGATGDPADNDQPMFYELQCYMAEFLYSRCEYTRDHYLDAPARAGTYGYFSADIAYVPITTTGDMHFRGRGGATLYCRNSDGGDNETLGTGQTYRCWGLSLMGGLGPTGESITLTKQGHICIENVILRGTSNWSCPAWPSFPANTDADIDNKGIACFGGAAFLEILYCQVHDFLGEEIYTSGNEIDRRNIRGNLTTLSPQCGLNTADLGSWGEVADNRSEDCYQACELVLGHGVNITGLHLGHAYSSYIIGGPNGSLGSHDYRWPALNVDLPIPLSKVQGKFERMTGVSLGQWLDLDIVCIDCPVAISDMHRDVYGRIVSICDTNNNGYALLVAGPATLTTVFDGTGSYSEPPRNIQLELIVGRTVRAQAASHSYTTGIQFTGILDTDLSGNFLASMMFDIKGAVQKWWDWTTPPAANKTQPLVRFPKSDYRTATNGQHFGLSYVYPDASGTYTFTPNQPGMIFYKGGSSANPTAVTVGSGWTLHADQRQFFYKGDASGTMDLTFANSAPWRLETARTMGNAWAELEVAYFNNEYREQRFLA